MDKTTKPPHGATLLLNLFAGESDFPQIEGDLREEFYQLASQSGPEPARKWYRREAWRNARALIRRPSVINALVGAAFCVAVFRLVTPLFFRWLRFELASAPRTPGLGFLLITLFEIATVLILGAVMSRVLKGRESLLRLTFTLFYLLTTAKFIIFSRIYAVWLSEPWHFAAIHSAMDQLGLLCVVASFWISSLKMERLTGVAGRER